MLRPAEDRTAALVGPKAAGEGAIKAWDTAREPSVSTAKVFIVMVEVGEEAAIYHVVGGKGSGTRMWSVLSVFGVRVGWGWVGGGRGVWLGRGRSPWKKKSRVGVLCGASLCEVVAVFRVLMVWWRREEEEEDQNPCC
jgi:hypothetical protein